MADREGRLKDKPRVIKAEIFPYDMDDEVKVIHNLSTLEQMGLIRRYVSQGIAVIEVVNFKLHQHPHHTEKASDLPAPEGQREDTVRSPLKNGGNPSDSLIPDSLNHDSLIPVHEDVHPKKATDVASRREEGRRMWPRVLAAIQTPDLQKAFPPDSDIGRIVNELGGWRALGLKNRDLRGQTEQRFLNAYVGDGQ